MSLSQQNKIQDCCGECGGILKGKAAAGRPFTYRRGFVLEIPADVVIPTCEDCGSRFMNRTTIKKLLKPQHDMAQRLHIEYLINRIQESINVSRREIEKACGVTTTYLLHVLAGREDASESLIGLLESYAIYPSEIKRRLNRKSGFDTESVRIRLRSTDKSIKS